MYAFEGEPRPDRLRLAFERTWRSGISPPTVAFCFLFPEGAVSLWNLSASEQFTNVDRFYWGGHEGIGSIYGRTEQREGWPVFGR